MARDDSQLQRARRHDWLWPTIADAVDTYIRRRASGAQGYERVWRLIHIWESVEITLAAVGITRLACEANKPGVDGRLIAELRRCRELCYGQSWDPEERDFKGQQGAFDGSIDRWIDILWRLARLESPPGEYLPKLKLFLNAEQISLGPFLEAWRNACDVPVKIEGARVAVRECIRQVNTFRNRYAHVPFPPPPIDEIASALEDVTDQLFGAKCEDNGPEPWNTRGVLTGAMLEGGRFLRGCGLSSFAPPDGITVTEPVFLFTYDQKGKEHEHWRSVPFAHLDASMNGYILTRLKNVDLGTWEYTRFKAEKSPVVTVDNAIWIREFQPPHPSEYPKPETPSLKEAPTSAVPVPPTEQQAKKVESFSDAIDAMRHDDFDGAIEFFESLVKVKPKYHIGWLKLGVARREKAVRLPDESRQETMSLLEKSIESLSKAAEHVDPEYKASAAYERSKARFRLSRMNADPTLITEALRDASAAARMSSDERYFTWVDYLERVPSPQTEATSLSS
ncbi:MAG: hypothetical protein HS101_18380 [Planctomycetia bacterium]|nr:hypothetical protein [Planctomycetia bacterium]